MGALTEEAVAGGTRKVDQLLAHYAESHRNPRNEVIHLVAIPLIMLSLVGLLCALHPWIAYVFVAASMVYFARLSMVFLLAMALLSAIALLLIHAMGERVLAISAVVSSGPGSRSSSATGSKARSRRSSRTRGSSGSAPCSCRAICSPGSASAGRRISATAGAQHRFPASHRPCYRK